MDNPMQAVSTVPTQTKQENPFAPSLLDKFMNFVEGLPLPYWLTYLLLFVAQSLVMHILLWADGWLPLFTFLPVMLLFPFWQWFSFAAMTYLDKVAVESLRGFSPLLDLEEGELNRLEMEFTQMPRRGVLLSGLAWSVIYSMLTAVMYEPYYMSQDTTLWFRTIWILEGLVTFATGSAIYYHSLRLLSLVDRTVKMVKHFNLFRLDPVYTFSNLTARVGITWLVLLTFTLLTFPIQFLEGGVLAIWILQGMFALAAFVLPLWFIHRRLEAEKLLLLAECDQHVEQARAKLHAVIQQDEMANMQPLNHALNGLAAERTVLLNIPTWPWRTGTMSGFLSALVLPIVLFIIQMVLKNLLGA